MQSLPKWLVQAIAGLVATLLLIISLNQLYVLGNQTKSVNSQNTITISAEGKVEAAPDLVTLSATVNSRGSTAAAAQSANTAKSDKVIEFIKSKGITGGDVRTSDYNVYPMYEYRDGANIITGYTANQTLTVKIRNFDTVAEMLDGLVKSGADQITGVYYSIENPDDVRQQAREKALSNAKEKAERLAKAAGVRLGKLVSFSENSIGGGPIPYYSKEMAAGMGGDVANSRLEPGTQDIEAQISVIYEIK